jgi:hypothetical protein
MDQVFPNANIVAGAAVLVVGFGVHWIAQTISFLNWDLGTRLGFVEEGLPPEYKVYEHGIAGADAAMGWLYGVAGLGLVLDAQWGYKLAWFPGVVLIYHGISFWFWSRNQRRAGHKLLSDSFRVGWFLANIGTGALAILLAWNAC